MSTLSSRNPMDWPAVYFCHIPKTGGSTLAGWMRKIYPKGSVLPYALLQELGGRSLNDLVNYRCYCGHFGTALDAYLPPSTRRIVMLREPVEATLSLIKYVARSDFSRLSFDQTASERIRQIQMLEGNIERCLQIEWMRNIFRSPQTRFLALDYQLSNYLDSNGSSWLAHIQEMDSVYWKTPGSKLEKAAKILDGMTAVGIFEDYTRSADLLMHHAGLPSPESWPVKNADPARSKQSDRRHSDELSETVLSDLHTLLEEDRQLYQLGLARYRKDLLAAEKLPKLERWAPSRDKSQKKSRIARIIPALFSWWKTCRWDHWWNYKLPPLWMACYAVFAYYQFTAAASPGLWIGLTLLAAGLGTMAHLLNDWSDLKDDAAAGKENRLSLLSSPMRWFLLLFASSTAVGGYYLTGAGWTGLLYIAGILACFALYSLPPFRLKTRGIWAAVADTTAVHILPLFFVLQCTGQAIPPALLFWALLWTAWGVRGFLSHQLMDRENDLASGLDTIASRYSAKQITSFTLFFLLPVELFALGSFLLVLDKPLLWIFASSYLMVEWARHNLAGVPVVVVEPRKKCRIFLQECYEIWLPLGMACILAFQNHLDFLMVVGHVLLFYPRLRNLFKQIIKLPKLAFRRMQTG